MWKRRTFRGLPREKIAPHHDFYLVKYWNNFYSVHTLGSVFAKYESIWAKFGEIMLITRYTLGSFLQFVQDGVGLHKGPKLVYYFALGCTSHSFFSHQVSFPGELRMATRGKLHQSLVGKTKNRNKSLFIYSAHLFTSVLSTHIQQFRVTKWSDGAKN